MKEAMFQKTLEKNKVRCLLCPHTCLINPGRTGICGVRKNVGGRLFSLIYGRASSIQPDPIEKKPLYHFLPGTRAMSFGTIGCNFKCDFCQNAGISQADVGRAYLRDIGAEEAVELAIKNGCASLAWTYNEPTIWFEFTYDASKIAHSRGLKNIYVTNGYIAPEPLRNIAPYLDAMNIDVKSFNEEFYRKIAGGKLSPVLESCKLAKELGIHIELTYLVVPDLNDDMEEIEKYMDWVLEELGPGVPLHFSAFHPAHNMKDRGRTPTSLLKDIHDTAADRGVHYVYLGNVMSKKGTDTYCPNCGKWVIKRGYMGLRKMRLDGSDCPKCGTEIPVIRRE